MTWRTMPDRATRRAHLKSKGWEGTGNTWIHPDKPGAIYTLAAAYRTQIAADGDKDAWK